MGGAYQFPFDEEVDGTMDVVSIQERLLPHRLCVTSWETRLAPVKTHGIVAPFHSPYSPFNKYTQTPAVTRAHTFTRKICGKKKKKKKDMWHFFHHRQRLALRSRTAKEADAGAKCTHPVWQYIPISA